MRRFRTMRRRVAALALLPLAAFTTQTSFAADATSSQARIETSSRTVEFGEEVTLRGAFPGAPSTPVEIRHRAKGARAWHTAASTRTGASGRYSVRVKPRRNGYWRAAVAAAQKATSSSHATPSATAPSAVDGDTASKRITVRSRTSARVAGRHTRAGRTVKIAGSVRPAGVKRRVVVRVGGEKETTTASRGGRFSIAWRAPSTGKYPVRVTARSNRVAAGSRDRAGAVTVYRPAAASWYGPGLYGNKLGCGGTLTPSTIGVAHKTMPCGTKLTLRYGNRSVDVRVIDRGPYVGGREFDLTAATKERLGFPDTGTVLSSR